MYVTIYIMKKINAHADATTTGTTRTTRRVHAIAKRTPERLCIQTQICKRKEEHKISYKKLV